MPSAQQQHHQASSHFVSALLESLRGGDLAELRPENVSNMHPFVALVGGTTSALVSALFYSVLAWQRNGVLVAFFLGSIANAILSKVLKKLIQQTRPPELQVSDRAVKPSDGGMPSSHAMSLGFIGTFTVVHLPTWWTIVPIVGFTVTSLLFRVQVKLHTWQQVAVGLTLGSTNACLFHLFAVTKVIELLEQFILNEQGLLPYPLLVIPAVVGALIVGSVERRITHWINQRREAKQTVSTEKSQ